MINKNNLEQCSHDIVWMSNRWFGVFPKLQKGVCRLCGKQFEKHGDKVVEKEDKDNNVK